MRDPEKIIMTRFLMKRLFGVGNICGYAHKTRRNVPILRLWLPPLLLVFDFVHLMGIMFKLFHYKAQHNLFS